MTNRRDFIRKGEFFNRVRGYALTEIANPRHALDNIGAGFERLSDEETRQRMVQYLSNL